MTSVATPAPSLLDQEYTLLPADFERIRQHIYQRAGISLQRIKHAMVYRRLSRRLRETGQASFTSYLGWLERAGDASEWQEFVNCLTTNLTSFFREDHHFDALVQDLRARAALGAKPVRVWCNAASTGEEPYSLAMTVLESLDVSANVRIVCSDIDTKVLATAHHGVYDAQSRGLSPERLRKHFLRGTGVNSGSIRVRPELARLIEFRAFNLMNPSWSGLGEAFDIVFCRNVMIYFDAATQRRVLERMHSVIKPGGLLYVGHSENFSDARELFRLRGKTIYERV